MSQIIKRTLRLSKFYSFATIKKAKLQKTLYQILELPSSSPQSNIRKNYLKLAKIFHPDVYKGTDKGRFQQIKKAYQILSDIRKRQQYDEQQGLKKKNSQSTQFETTINDKDDSQYNKKNNFDYDAKQEKATDFDQEYQKFMKKKKQTDFQEIRLHQQVQFRQMNEQQRMRFRFRQLYVNDAAQLKIEQTQSFQQLLDDQIGQRNIHHEDIKKRKQTIQKINSEQNIKKQKKIVYLLAIVGAMIFYPLFFSFWTKYKLQRQQQYKLQQIIQQIRRKTQQAQIRSRFSY